MDEKILAYRSELQKRSENTPFWTRTILTVEEAAAYTGIGRAKIRQIISQGNCPFPVNNGNCTGKQHKDGFHIHNPSQEIEDNFFIHFLRLFLL